MYLIRLSIPKKNVYRKFTNHKTIQSVSYSKRQCGSKESMQNPQNLPPLPIPKLEYTLEKFLTSCEPLVTYSEHQDTKKICNAFQKGEGKKLQKYLVEHAEKSNNWLDEWYTKIAYLGNRNSITMNTSPIVTLPRQNFLQESHFTEYIAKLILAVLRFKQLCDCNQFPLDTWKKYPLDMGVYKKLFSMTRIPHEKFDKILHYPDSQHIIVIINNNFFKMKVIGLCSTMLNFSEILKNVNNIINMAGHPGVPFGLLTTLNRNKWASLYEEMQIIGNNEQYLKDIEQALFIVNIDKAFPCEIESEKDFKLNSCKNAFHGHGQYINGANRWYGKTLQFFVSPNGSSGIIFEHSPVEALPLGRMADFIINYISGNEWQFLPKSNIRDTVSILQFANSGNLKIAMSDASQAFEKQIQDFCIETLHYDRFGKEFVKEHKISTDAVLQLAFQHAYVTLHQEFVPQQETVSTRKFFLGRNDIVRTCTNEVVRFIKIMRYPINREHYENLKFAVAKHTEMIDDVMTGKGIDAHLFGLLMASREMNVAPPAFFKCEAYRRCSKFKIAARQLRTSKNCFTCFAPGLSGGYSCCYNPRAEDINVCVTCRKNEFGYDPKNFLEAWSSCLNNISELLLRYREKTVSPWISK